MREDEQIPELGSPDLCYRYASAYVLSLHILSNCLTFRQKWFEDRQLYYKPLCVSPTIPLFYYNHYGGPFMQKVMYHKSKHTLKYSTFINQSCFLKGDGASVNTHTRLAKRQDGGRLHCLREAINTDPVRECFCLPTYTHTTIFSGSNTHSLQISKTTRAFFDHSRNSTAAACHTQCPHQAQHDKTTATCDKMFFFCVDLCATSHSAFCRMLAFHFCVVALPLTHSEISLVQNPALHSCLLNNKHSVLFAVLD